MPISFSWSFGGANGADAAGQSSAVAALPRDFKLDAGGDLEVVANEMLLVSGQEAIRQDLLSRLAFIRGDWFLDLDRGIPYFDGILGTKAPNLPYIRSEFAAAIEGVVGVLQLITLTVNLNIDRTLEVAFTVTTDVGELSAAGTLEVQ